VCLACRKMITDACFVDSMGFYLIMLVVWSVWIVIVVIFR